MIDGVNYEVTPSRPGLQQGRVGGERWPARISGPPSTGQPVDPAQKFYVVTNNYRAGGGGHRASTAATSSMKILRDAGIIARVPEGPVWDNLVGFQPGGQQQLAHEGPARQRGRAPRTLAD